MASTSPVNSRSHLLLGLLLPVLGVALEVVDLTVGGVLGLLEEPPLQLEGLGAGLAPLVGLGGPFATDDVLVTGRKIFRVVVVFHLRGLGGLGGLGGLDGLGRGRLRLKSGRRILQTTTFSSPPIPLQAIPPHPPTHLFATVMGEKEKRKEKKRKGKEKKRKRKGRERRGNKENQT